MEGIFFYWIMWLAWIITTFLMNKGKNRLKLTIFLLVTILLSKWNLVALTHSINMSLLMFLVLGYYLAVKNHKLKLVSFYLTSLTLTFAYTGIMLFRIYDPVWFIIDFRLMISVLVSLLAIYLGENKTQRFSIFLISICQGEFLYWIVLSRFYNQLTIGTEAFLDMLSIGCAVIFLWTIIQQLTLNIEQSLVKMQKPIKEKQG